MSHGERRQQRLAQQEDSEEPQRLPEPVASDHDELPGYSREQQGCQ